MTIKINVYQKYGEKTNYCADSYEFCCFDSLKEWLKNFQYHTCKKCKDLNKSKGF